MANENIDLLYQETIAPENYFSNFKNKYEFISELKKGDKVNLEFAVEQYAEVEMYIEAAIIRDFINENFQ